MGRVWDVRNKNVALISALQYRKGIMNSSIRARRFHVINNNYCIFKARTSAWCGYTGAPGGIAPNSKFAGFPTMTTN